MRIVGIALAAVLGLAVVGRAEPVELKQVATDAKWLAHVDVDAMRESVVVQKAYHKCMEMHKDAQKHFDKVRETLGLDLKKDLHGITIYGKDLDKHHGVLIVHADVNQKLLLEKAEKAADHKVAKYGSYEIHSWTHKHGKESHTAYGVFFKPNVLVFAGCEEAIHGALDVLDGKSPGITDEKSPLAGRLAPGASLIVRALAVGPQVKCPVLKDADSFRITLGENKGESFYRARLVMKSAEAAEQVKAVVEGFKAMVGLARGSDAETMKLVNAVKVTTQEKTVRIAWSAPAEEVWTALEKAAKEMRAKWAKKHGPAASGDVHKAPTCSAKGDKATCPAKGDKATCPAKGDKAK
jgi:hypothetical protein